MHGIPISEERYTGSEIEKLYIKKEWEKIKQHCKQDIELLEKLFEKVCFNYLKSKRRL